MRKLKLKVTLSSLLLLFTSILFSQTDGSNSVCIVDHTFSALHPELIDGVVAMNGMANHFEYGKFQEAIAELFGGRKQLIPQEYKKAVQNIGLEN